MDNSVSTLWHAAIAASAAAGFLLPALSDAQAQAPVRATADPFAGRCTPDVARLSVARADVRVLVAKAYRRGDTLPNRHYFDAGDPAVPSRVKADLCFVKMLVGPGNPGPADAPSTSKGIGIEVWLPATSVWNGRIHAVGNGGWAGGEEADPARISSMTATPDSVSAHDLAAREGAVTSGTDTGHASPGPAMFADASFAMLPDGTPNRTLWEDFSARAIHEQIVVTKALVRALYGRPARHAYWDGGSTGGRQALKLAQRYPTDFDGIVAAFPAINWTKFATAELYPQIVIQRDLGGRMPSAAQIDLVSNAAIAACDMVDGQHLGFVLDPAACRYDPMRDPAVLCVASGGRNATPACVDTAEARAINKFWYGMTIDGSVPDPAVDNGFGALTAVHRWYGLARGTSLRLLAGDGPFPIAQDVVALETGDVSRASGLFRNASNPLRNSWKTMGYADLAAAFDRGIALQPQFGLINTDDPDLSAFKAHGGKLIQYHGTADGLIFHRGSIDYYERVRAGMGGAAIVDPFYRLFVIAGMGHGPYNGTSSPAIDLPIPQPGRGEIYALLTAWVERGAAPAGAILHGAGGGPVAKSLPLCAYPTRAVFQRGSIHAATSYACR